MKRFNIRVYGVLINDHREILLSDEIYKGQNFTKFPGGGLCYGEGVIQALEREFLEEANLRVQVNGLLYVTEAFIASVFDDSQVVGVYYSVSTQEEVDLNFRELSVDGAKMQVFRWEPLASFSADQLTFEMDQKAWCAIQKSKYC